MNVKAVLGSILREMSFWPYLSCKDLVIVSLKKSVISIPQVSKEILECGVTLN
jgi:hypothetical protein